MQMDFAAQGRPSFTDVWVEWTDLPVLGNVRVGQWKQPFSLEVVSSFRYTTFMERSVLFQAFTPFRHIGVGAYNHRDDLMGTWAVSLIRTGQDQYGDSLSTAGGNGVVGRITRLAWYDEAEGRSYLHYGGGYFLNVPPHHAHRFRTIPEIFVGENRANGIGTAGFPVPGVFDGTPFFVDTGPLPGVEHVQTFGLESLLVHGPLSIQAEAMTALVDRSASPTATLSGSYVQAGYFLTGEHRPYDRVAGAIDRVKPFEDFFLVNGSTGPCYGKGAWEVALRWSYIDLNGGDIRGGSMNDLTAGVNWYCNPYSKVVFNFVHSWLDDRNGGESEANAFAMRTQMDF
jgi:phosphate-selective porin OprO/OprP